MKLTNLYKRMALRGKVLSVALLLLFLSLILFVGVSVYNLPSLVQNRAIHSVNALFTQNDDTLSAGVAQNTGRISSAQKSVNKLSDESLRLFLLSRLGTAQKMADTLNGVNSLYNTKEDGSRTVIKNIQLFQIDNINKNLAELDALGKTKFTEAVRADLAQASVQYDIYKQINDLINSLYADGEARTQLSEDATSEIIDQSEELLAQLENADLKSDLVFSFSQIRIKVKEQEAAQAAIRRAEEEAREAERKAEEEAKKAEDEAKKNSKDTKTVEDTLNKIIDSIKPQ